MGTLTLFREPVAWADRLRAYTVMIDGKSATTIRQGETIDMPLPNCLVRIQMKIDWATSEELLLDGQQNVVMRCRANTKPWQALLWITVWRKNYIALEHA